MPTPGRTNDLNMILGVVYERGDYLQSGDQPMQKCGYWRRSMFGWLYISNRQPTGIQIADIMFSQQIVEE